MDLNFPSCIVHVVFPQEQIPNAANRETNNGRKTEKLNIHKKGIKLQIIKQLKMNY